MNITIFEKEQYEPIKKAGELAGKVLDLVYLEHHEQPHDLLMYIKMLEIPCIL